MTKPLCRALATGALLLALAAHTAHADGLAPVRNDGPLSAYGGWVLWSEQQHGGRWALTAWHAGVETRLPVATREVPFDADVGPDEQGRPVATYSRCAHEPVSPDFSFGLQPPDGMTPFNGVAAWSAASGCRLYRLVLDRRGPLRERRLDVPGPGSASDTTPSQWRGMIAFGRRRRGTRVMQLMVLDVRTHRLRRLHAGSVPRGKRGPRVGEIQQLDLGAQTAALLWRMEGPSVLGTIGPGWELRGVRLADGRSATFAAGGIDGTCGASLPGSPNAVGTTVVFDLVRYDCDVAHTLLSRGSLVTGHVGQAETGPPVAWRAALDGGDLYTVRGPRPPETSEAAPCEGDAGPCVLDVEPSPY